MTAPEIHILIRQLGNRRRVGSVLETLIELGPVAVAPLCEALTDRNPDIRWNAAKAILWIANAGSVPLLTQAMGNRDAYVRELLARTFEKIGLPAVKPLIELLDDSEKDVCQIAARALTRIGETRVTEPLLRGLGDRDPRVRLSSAAALGKLKNTHMIQPLIQTLILKLGDKNREVRLAAIEALRPLGHTDTLYRMILKETSLTPQQRFFALSALDRVWDLRAYCTEKLDDIHESVQLGAQAVLDVSILLIPSNLDATPASRNELLRGAEPTISTPKPSEMLRASNISNVSPPNTPKPRGILARLLGR